MYFGGRFRDRGYGCVPLAAAAGHGMMLNGQKATAMTRLTISQYGPRAMVCG